MKKLLGLTLGIMTALGGFVDLGQIVFTMQAGSIFGYSLLWAVALGLIGIVVYMEMSGRIAAVAKQPVFEVVRKTLGDRMGLFTLIMSNLLNLFTCAAELGGIGILLHLTTGWSERASMLGAILVLGLLTWISRFQWIERVFGLSGMMMVIFAVSAWKLKPEWKQVAHGFVPSIPAIASNHLLLVYAYFAVGIFSAMLMEYEVHFYSSGAIEEKWTKSDLGENVLVSSLGSTLGAVLSCALLVLGAIVFLPRSIIPNSLSATLMPANLEFTSGMLNVAIAGTLACITGAAIETALSGAYNVCQFFNFKWGKNRSYKQAPLFTALWVGMLAMAAAVALSGIRPLTLVNGSVVFGMVIMPLTYYPILAVAGNRHVLGKHANGRIYNLVGWIVLGIIAACALAAVPLAVLTKFGQL